MKICNDTCCLQVIYLLLMFTSSELGVFLYTKTNIYIKIGFKGSSLLMSGLETIIDDPIALERP